MAARLTLRDRGRTGLGQEVVPGPVQQYAGDDMVTLALGDEHGQVGEPSGVVEHEVASERGAAAEPDDDHRLASWCDFRRARRGTSPS